MNNDRSAVELGMFALSAAGIYTFIWSVILTCGVLSALGLLMLFTGITVLSLRNA